MNKRLDIIKDMLQNEIDVLYDFKHEFGELSNVVDNITALEKALSILINDVVAGTL